MQDAAAAAQAKVGQDVQPLVDQFVAARNQAAQDGTLPGFYGYLAGRGLSEGALAALPLVAGTKVLGLGGEAADAVDAGQAAEAGTSLADAAGGSGAVRSSPGPFAPQFTRVLGSDVKNVGVQVQGNFPTTPQAPNTVMYRADSAGNITHYQVWAADGLPAYRVDVTGAPHGNVPTPHVLEYERNLAPSGKVFNYTPDKVRAATPSEIP